MCVVRWCDGAVRQSVSHILPLYVFPACRGGAEEAGQGKRIGVSVFFHFPASISAPAGANPGRVENEAACRSIARRGGRGE